MGGEGVWLIEMMRSGLPGQQGLVSVKTTTFSFDCLQPRIFLEIAAPHPISDGGSWT